MLTVKNQLPIQLGTLKYGVKHSFEVTLVNSAETKININKVYVGCTACTTAEINKKTLDPKEEVILNIHFTPGSTGNQNKQVSVAYSSDDNKVYPDLSIKFKATVNE